MPSWAWAENYLCISDGAAGFRVENEEYKPTVSTGGDKYIVSVENGTVTPHGREGPIVSNCQNHDNRIYCTGFTTFFVHKSNLRFMRFHTTYGYAYANNDDTPFVEIGVCTKF